MRSKIVTLVLFLFALQLSVSGQKVARIDSVSFEKARYLKEDLNRFLSKNTKYPIKKFTALEHYDENTQGDVMYTFVITKEGKMENLKLENATDDKLSNSAFEALNKLENSWSPTKLNHIAVDKSYRILFRFRSYLDTKPPVYKKQIAGLVKRRKYDKAIKLYDEQIRFSPCDFELFAERSKLKKIAGDSIGAIEDFNSANKLEEEFMAIVNVVVIGQTSRYVFAQPVWVQQ